jgi:uncharacterized RDD family membrane protein YckC
MVYASFGKRFFASLIDSILLGIFSFVLLWAISFSKTSALLIMGLFFLIAIMYPVVSIALYGQTIGKLLVKIKVVRNEHERCGWLEGFLRVLPVVIVQCTLAYFILNLVNEAPAAFFESTDYSKKLIAFNAITRDYFAYGNLSICIWVVLDGFVYLSSGNVRALHDVIARTNVINKGSDSIKIN